MMTQKKLDTERVIAMIDECRGNLSAAAARLGCHRNTLRSYINAHPTCKAALERARESMIDNVESVLYSKALAGEAWAVCFFLKTQAKHRGYVERQELANSPDSTFRVTWDDVENGN